MPRSAALDQHPQIGQLLIVGFDGAEMSSRLASLLTRLQPAGVILFARNIKTAQQTWQLLGDCQRCVATPLLTSIDLEGGTVDRLREVLGAAPSAAEVFSTADRWLFRRHGEILGENCRALGFNLNFAPVLDLAYEASRSVLGTRAVSSDPRQAIVYAREFLAGLRAAKVFGCGKHFPGLGEGILDSHHALPVIEKSLPRLWGEDLLPYRELRKQLPFAMISHAAYPAAASKGRGGDRASLSKTPASLSKLPASLSKMWITDILRKRIGYRNLIVSDDLEMGGVLAAAPIGEAAVEFIRAGGDLCLVCHREDYILQAHEALVKTAAGDRKFARRAEESVWRVAAFKKKSAALLRLGKAPSEAKVETLSRQLWEFSERVRLEPLARASDRKEFDRKGNDRRVRVKDRKNKDRKEENRKVKDRRRP